jgi:hypothetical protein
MRAAPAGRCSTSHPLPRCDRSSDKRTRVIVFMNHVAFAYRRKNSIRRPTRAAAGGAFESKSEF